MGGCARRAFRVVRGRTDAKTGATSTETAYGISCVLAARAGPERLLALNRSHWQVEKRQPLPPRRHMGEDASRARKGHAAPTTPPLTTSPLGSSSTAASARCRKPTSTS